MNEFEDLSSFRESDTELNISIEVLDFSITDVDSCNGGKSNTGSELSIDGINVLFNKGAEFSCKSSWVNSKGGALNGDCSNAVRFNFTEDLSTIVCDVANDASIVIFNNKGIFSVHNEGNNVWSLEGSIFSGEFELRNFLGKLDFNCDWDSLSVFSSKLRDSSSKLISGDVNSKLGKVGSEVDLLLGLMSGEKEGVDGVVSQEELEVFAGIISDWGGGNGVGDVVLSCGVKEGSIHLSANESLGWDLRSSPESIV